MSEPIYLLTIGLPLLTVLLVFAMRFVTAILQSRARLADEAAYRRVAETAATSGAETANALSTIQAALVDVGTRLTAIERILKEVG